ncbi:MAG: thiamine pyrophosphate-dependent enzyme [Verrucomicrobia bacterium]|nr:thiamine pyrophosphate-dependent enzyme [Verrucomicrobiota bacterium]MDA1065561.1 thiamine pyrophosphate-dependent enzyme [Verrucomicrobiota bacterium]
MLNKYTCLEKLAARRKKELFITCMGTAKPWEKLSDTDLDFASVDSAMSHAADFALGIAIAKPELRVITLNGDGSMVMCLGTFITLAQRPCENYAMIIVENGTYEVTGNQKVPGVGIMDFEAMARGAGLEKVYTIDNEEAFEEILPKLFEEPGPLVCVLKVEPAEEGVPKFDKTLAERTDRLRKALNS